MRMIEVTPDLLDLAAARIDQENQNYLQNVNRLFQEVDTLGNAWKGKDNLAFVSQISSFQNDFQEISRICEEYSTFLKNSSRSYRNIQDELTAAVGRLER